MVWVIGIIVFIFLMLGIFLVNVLEIEVDTRVPRAGIRWGFLGKAKIWYEEEWWISFQLIFFKKTMSVASIKWKTTNKKKSMDNKVPKKRMKMKSFFGKFIRILRTFKVKEWDLKIDTGDNLINAQLYPLNFLSKNFQQEIINFRNENYLLLRIRNYPWKILYAFLK